VENQCLLGVDGDNNSNRLAAAITAIWFAYAYRYYMPELKVLKKTSAEWIRKAVIHVKENGCVI
jgi:hypothetical protein